MPVAPKPLDGLRDRFVGDAESPGDRRITQAELLEVERFRGDLLVDRCGSSVQKGGFEGDCRSGSNSLRPCPPLSEQDHFPSRYEQIRLDTVEVYSRRQP